MSQNEPDTDELLEQVAQDVPGAMDELLKRYRDRLKKMIAIRLDSRLAKRVDASDIVQDTLEKAFRKLPQYLKDRPLPFYLWLRQIAWERLVESYRRHVSGKKRSLRNEVSLDIPLPDQSAVLLARQLIADQSSPSKQAMRREQRGRIQSALTLLAPQDREVVVLRHLERLKLREIALTLQISEAAAQSRYRRAVERLHQLLCESSEGKS